MKKKYTIAKVRNNKKDPLIGALQRLSKTAAERIDNLTLKALAKRYGRKWIIANLNLNKYEKRTKI